MKQSCKHLSDFKVLFVTGPLSGSFSVLKFFWRSGVSNLCLWLGTKQEDV